MIYCQPITHLSQIFRSKHYLISLLKSPAVALKKAKRPTINRRRNNNNNNNNDNNDVLDTFPKEFHRKTFPNSEMSRKLYIVNNQTAKKIGQHLSASNDNGMTIVETDPGFGLLTSVLLENGIKDLRLFEARTEFMQHLKENYSDVYPDRIKLKHGDLLGLHKSVYCDNLDAGTRTEEILSGLPTTEWQNEINFRLFGATGSTKFFKHLISSIVHQNSIMALGRCEMFMVVPSTIYFDLTSSKKAGYIFYRAFTILFQIFFEYELLDKFSRSDFLPYIGNNTNKSISKKESHSGKGSGIKWPPLDPELMYFVKIVPRRNLYQLCPPNQIQELWHFIKRNCVSRQNRIIPSLEKLIPGCGGRLLLKFNTENPVRSTPIDVNHLCELPAMTNPSCTLSKQDYYDNLNIYTQFGDLQPVQLLTLFYEFRMLPEYSSSNFLPSLESVLLKYGAPSDGIESGNVKISKDSNSADDGKDDDVVKDK